MIYRQLLFILFAAVAVEAQTANNVWNGITPLHSTRTDVEKLLGKPKKKQINLYETENEKVVIWYSEGTCKENTSSIWNAPKETVVGIGVSPKKTLFVSALTKILSQRFRKEEEKEIKGNFVYFAEDGSVMFATKLLPDGTEDVVNIVYAPSEADNYLRCSSIRKVRNKKLGRFRHRKRIR